MRLLLCSLLILLLSAVSANAADVVITELRFPALDLDQLAREDQIKDATGHGPWRFAVSHAVAVSPNNAGHWTEDKSGIAVWRLSVQAKGAVHLNFGFKHFALPPGAALRIRGADGTHELGPYTEADRLPHGQLWTPILPGADALLELRVPAPLRDAVDLQLSHVGQGYRGFGHTSKWCKAGACNTDVACLAASDPWNLPRRAVGAYTRNGSNTCTGSLLNNTANDRRMLFATASHCNISSDAVAATVVVYWNYESPTCRTPGSAESGQVLPKPSSTTQGLRLLAATPSISGSSGTTSTRSDFTLLELATPPANNTFNLYWAGWDRSSPPLSCAAPADASATTGLCASIHHPGVSEKRITFVEVPLTQGNYGSAATGLHWDARWDPTPPLLPNIQPTPSALPPSVTEPGSSGSPLYNAQQRFIGVLSGGPSACGATGESLRDYYGGLFHAWEGLGTPTTRMRDHLDPLNTGAVTLDGIGACTPPAAPNGLTATANGNNRIDLAWSAVAGAERYRVYRAQGACPGGTRVQIAEVTSPSFSDSTVSGGTSYSYSVSAIRDGCESTASSCSAATALGACNLPPTFAGLSGASNNASSSCAIGLTWPAASAQCGSAAALRYNVYRATSADFAADASTLLASCLSTLSHTDSTVAPGATYHYLVRAEDSAAGNGSGRCGGVEESNLVRRSAAAFGPTLSLLADDIETGAGNWTVSGSGSVGANFSIVSSASNSPTRSWFVPDPNAVSDRQLSLNSVLRLGSGAELVFFHRYQTEAGNSIGYDGGVLEYSLDGLVWSDILAGSGAVPANPQRFLAGGYDRTISTDFGSALAGRAAWSGNNGSFQRVRVDLTDFAGRDLRLRWRFASDSSVAGTGWWIDDVRVLQATSCSTTDPNLVFKHGFEAP